MTPALQYTYTFCGFVKMYCGNTWLAGVILHISTYCVLRMGSHWRKLSFVKQLAELLHQHDTSKPPMASFDASGYQTKPQSYVSVPPLSADAIIRN